MIRYFRLIFCKFNIHYHPENDGLYLVGYSTGRCHSCGKLIYKNENSIWRID